MECVIFSQYFAKVYTTPYCSPFVTEPFLSEQGIKFETLVQIQKPSVSTLFRRVFGPEQWR